MSRDSPSLAGRLLYGVPLIDEEHRVLFRRTRRHDFDPPEGLVTDWDESVGGVNPREGDIAGANGVLNSLEKAPCRTRHEVVHLLERVVVRRRGVVRSIWMAASGVERMS